MGPRQRGWRTGMLGRESSRSPAFEMADSMQPGFLAAASAQRFCWLVRVRMRQVGEWIWAGGRWRKGSERAGGGGRRLPELRLQESGG